MKWRLINFVRRNVFLIFSEKEKKEIESVVGSKMTCEDREPAIVIDDRYKGKANRWYRDMVRWHQIKFSS